MAPGTRHPGSESLGHAIREAPEKLVRPLFSSRIFQRPSTIVAAVRRVKPEAIAVRFAGRYWGKHTAGWQSVCIAKGRRNTAAGLGVLNRETINTFTGRRGARIIDRHVAIGGIATIIVETGIR